MIIIEKATLEDISEVKQLLSYTWKDTYGSFLEAQTIEKVTTVWHHPEALKSQAEDPDTYFAVAKDENRKIVGLITVGRIDKKRVHMARLYVHPEAQRQGIGHQLLTAALKAFPNTEVVRLEVEEKNRKGVSFYNKQGFREVERRIVDIEGEQMALPHFSGKWCRLLRKTTRLRRQSSANLSLPNHVSGSSRSGWRVPASFLRPRAQLPVPSARRVRCPAPRCTSTTGAARWTCRGGGARPGWW
jgi:ribosomal protein S18 acetylase RimI-like enzyme